MSQAIIDQILSLTRSHEIDWQNYKDTRPKYNLEEVQFRRLTAATKYPKRVMPVRDGYNKYQSYYAFKDDLVICLTKGKRDSRLLLIVGNVIPNDKKYYDTNLTVITDQEADGKVQQLFDLIHQPYGDQKADQEGLESIHEQLKG